MNADHLENQRRKAQQMMENEQHQEAAQLLLSLQTDYPTHSGLMNDLGVVFSQTGMPDLGRSYFERALYLNPQDEDAQANLKLLQSLNTGKETEVDFKQNANSSSAKILFAAENLDPPIGGAEESALNILKTLAKEGYQITAVCGGKKNMQYRKWGIDFHRITDIQELIDACQFDKQNLVLTQLIWAPLIAKAAKKFNKPVFLFLRSYEHFCASAAMMTLCDFQCENCDLYQANRKLIETHRQVFDKVDMIFSNSQYMNEFQQRFSGRQGEVIYPVIDFERVIPPLRNPAFTSLARPTDVKGVFIFDAIAKMNPRERFLVFGRHGEFLPDFAKNIVFWGHGDPRIMYAKVNILIVPSLWAEPFGRVVLEAMANGIPVIASRVGGLPEAGGDAAIYIDNFQNPAEWNAAINQVKSDSETFKEMQKRGFEQVRKFKDRDDIGKLINIVRSTLEKSAVPQTAPIVKKSQSQQYTPAHNTSYSGNGKAHVLHIKTPYYLPLSETFIYNYLRNFQRFIPVIMTHEIREMGVFPLEHPIVRFEDSTARTPAFQAFLRELGARFNPQVIHAHFGHVGAEWINWSEMTGLPFIASFYGKDASTYLSLPGWKDKFARLFQKASAITVLCQDMKRRLIEAGCPPEKIRIIHLGVNLKEHQFRRRILHPTESVKFLCVGRLVEKKGFDDAIRAFAQARKEMKCQLRIVGEGPMEEQLRKLTEELSVAKDVFFLGAQPVSYVRDEMMVNHILLAPSKIGSDGDMEGTPTVLIEAQACGLPVIATRHAGIPEVVEDGVTGVLVSEGDWKTLSEKMRSLIRQPETWSRMGNAGRKKVEAEFNIITETEKLERLYHQVANQETDQPETQFDNYLVLGGGNRSYPDNGKKQIHIAVDASALEDKNTKVRGIGRYMFNHFKELIPLKPDWRFSLCGVTDAPFLQEEYVLLENANCDFLPWKQYPDLKPDLLYMPNPVGPISKDIMQLVNATNSATACTFHDLMPLIFPELYFKPNPEYEKLYMEHLAEMRDKCGLFLCNSQCTADDLHERAGIPKSRLKVIHAGVTENFAQTPTEEQINTALKKHGLKREGFLMFTGVPDQRKNAAGMFMGLTKALSLLNSELKLAVVGDIPDFLLNILKALEAKYDVPSGAVIYTGFISEEELNALYHSGLGLLFTSLYEGFGFPIVEANSAGMPVIAGRNSSQIEVAADAAVLVDAYNVNEIADAIVELYRNEELRKTLKERGLKNYRRFTWRKTAEKTALYLHKFIMNEVRSINTKFALNSEY